MLLLAWSSQSFARGHPVCLDCNCLLVRVNFREDPLDGNAPWWFTKPTNAIQGTLRDIENIDRSSCASPHKKRLANGNWRAVKTHPSTNILFTCLRK